MSKEEVEAVLGHEVTHVANGDMVTLTLIQGVLNTFVFFLSRVVGFIVDKAVFRTERGVGPGFYITMIVSQILFGIAASAIVAWFSRRREFRADAGSAGLLGSPQPMIAALSRLGSLQTAACPTRSRRSASTATRASPTSSPRTRRSRCASLRCSQRGNYEAFLHGMSMPTCSR
jgi:heat shock protein HtpX